MSSESTRQVLIGLITDTEFCKEYFKTFSEPVFKGILGASLIEQWCKQYYAKYGTSIGKNISVGYDSCVRSKSQPPEVLQYIEMLLISLSNESDIGEKLNTSFLMDLAITEANKNRLSALRDELEDALDRENTTTALQAYEKFKRVEQGVELPKFNLLEDTSSISEKVMEAGAEYILKPNIHSAYEQEVFIQPIRSEYVIYKAKSKGYKTFAMYYIALQAALQKKNVLLFSLGDLNEQMSLKRLFGLLLHKPTLDNQANKQVRVPHIDCYKSKYNTCLNINRDGDVAYQDEHGNYNQNYKRCTACAKCKKPFPVCVTHTMESTGDAMTSEDVEKAIQALKMHMGESGIFDFYSFSACERTVSDISDIVESYFESGKVIDLVVIDYWGQLKVPAGYEKSPLFEQVTKQAVDLKNMCTKFNIACVIADQASIRPTEVGMSSDDLLSESSFTGGQNKITYTASCINSSVQQEDRQNGTIKVHISMSRYGFGETQSDGYILTTCPVSCGQFASESFHVTSAHLKEIEDFKAENNIDNVKGKKRR